MFKNRNFALERSQREHSKRCMDNYLHENVLLCDYHRAVYNEQESKKAILSKKRRKELFKKHVLYKTPEFRHLSS